ncbi:MAG: VCBS repeat-containing protein [Thermodesulfobacteriota bacterium]|nr:VCBS repeat-containing protein [Thermodesulfobacteriota bacterium]
MKADRKRRCYGFVLLLSLLFLATSGATAREPYRLVIVPFKINADRDLSFLKEGILDMLTSRLSVEGKVAVISRGETAAGLRKTPGPVNEPAARTLGQNLKADYVLFGSLTMLGESLSLDGKLLDVHGKRPVVTLFKEGRKIDEVIPQISLFAKEIKEKVFGVPVTAAPKIAETPAEAPRPGIYAHPETLLASEPREEVASSKPEPAPTLERGFAEPAPSVQEGGFAEPPGTSPAYKKPSAFWASRNFRATINGIALGDVDGDQKTEVVFITDRRVFVHRFQDQGLVKVWEKSGDRGCRYIAVDVGDVNNNGLAEIFVTNVKNPGDRLGSFVLEWDGRAFKRISEDANWYYRVADLPYQGRVLLGQKRAMDEPFADRVSALTWQNGEYQPQEPVTLPKRANLFGFAQGDVTNKGLQTTVAFDREDHLRLFSLSGDEKWRSGEVFGGSMNYVESWVKNSDIADRLYLPQRIYVLDLDGDGKQEVVVPSNEGQMGRLFAKLRSFSSGHMTSLAWNGLTLVPELQTPKLEGYISDFGIGDFDNDGAKEVVVAHVGKARIPVFGGVSSSIISYEITGASSGRD